MERTLDEPTKLMDPYSGPTGEGPDNVFDVDESVYLRRWMRSGAWGSSASLAFWRNASSGRRGVVLSKNLVVAGMNLMEKAAMTCRDRYRVAEKTEATIDAAMIEGIPSNIDLFKELVLAVTIIARSLERLRRWEWDDPLVTTSFLGHVYTLIELVVYISDDVDNLAAGMLTLKGLKEQGRLGRFFGKVTIYDQPPSNTIQKIIALKEAMREIEKYLQNMNVVLLKFRSILIAGQPQ
ncbi:hypothetical protein CASFOL_004594 [Castilleja foliolosa]|uniref:Uncharacterized protein n=1 Tax=Castilleja foliolosa TaxID=1961234 RepID=A0ABD3ECY0_9LAMI